MPVKIYKKKAPSQLRRDRQRKEEFYRDRMDNTRKSNNYGQRKEQHQVKVSVQTIGTQYSEDINMCDQPSGTETIKEECENETVEIARNDTNPHDSIVVSLKNMPVWSTLPYVISH